MKETTVRSLMIPLERYATVRHSATLHEVVLALAEAHQRLHHSRHPHRAVLVQDETDRVVGKMSMFDVLRALEPRYREISDFNHSMRFGFSSNFIRSMVKNYELWQKPMDDLCRKAAQILVKDVMYTPADGEYVRVDATLDEAIHQLVVGHHQSLIVTDDQKKVVGVLRLTDVFFEVSDRIKKCLP